MPRRYLRRILPNRKIMSRDRTLRIFGSLLHEPNLWHLNRRSVSLAVAVGLFMAFMPLPVQMLMAAATAIVVRCNLPVAVAVVWVSNPITVAPLFFAAYKVGAWLLGLPQRRVDYELSFDWLADPAERRVGAAGAWVFPDGYSIRPARLFCSAAHLAAACHAVMAQQTPTLVTEHTPAPDRLGPITVPETRFDQPVHDAQDLVHPCRQLFVMGDDDQAGTCLDIELEHESVDLLRGAPVQVARWLIGKHAPGPGHQGPRDGRALSLAAGQLPRFVIHTFPKPCADEDVACLLGGLARAHAAHEQRHAHVLQRGKLGQTDGETGKRIRAARYAAGRVPLPRDATSGVHSTRTSPALGLSKPPSKCSSVLLPEPDAPTMATRSPARNRQVDAAQHLNVQRSLTECTTRATAFEHRGLTHSVAPPPAGCAKRARPG